MSDETADSKKQEAGQVHGPVSGGSQPIPRPQTVNSLLKSFQEQMKKMDELENRIEIRAAKTRRRICNLMETTPPTRQSRVRIWFSHTYNKANYKEGIPEQFVIHLEGTLLVGHLDHKSAAEFDKRTGYVAPKDDLDRSKGGEKEDDQPVRALRFTHLMESLEVELQTVFKPKNPVPIPTNKKKKSSRRSDANTNISVDPTSNVDLRTCRMSETTELLWKHDMSDDANAWCIKYRPATPPDPDFMAHSVVMKVKFDPSMHAELATMEGTNHRDRYSICHPMLVQRMFPHHRQPAVKEEKNAEDQSSPHDIEAEDVSAKPPPPKRKAEESTADGHPLPATDNEVTFPPSTLTMAQMMMAFYTYIQDNRLADPENPSVIVCDQLLQDVLGMERLSFSQLQKTLTQTGAIAKVAKPYPLIATYVLRPDEAPATPWQFDTECDIPSLVGYRWRELLRRVKRRELEYTSSRTKARYMLAARTNNQNDAMIRQLIDAAVSETSLNVPEVWHSLARGAPPNSEARRAAQMEARMSYLLLEVLPEKCKLARRARNLVSVCEKRLINDNMKIDEDL